MADTASVTLLACSNNDDEAALTAPPPWSSSASSNVTVTSAEDTSHLKGQHLLSGWPLHSAYPMMQYLWKVCMHWRANLSSAINIGDWQMTHWGSSRAGSSVSTTVSLCCSGSGGATLLFAFAARLARAFARFSAICRT